MDIIDYIDLNKPEHLKELDTLISGGEWSPEFYQKLVTSDIQFTPNWFWMLMFKIAKQFIKEKLDKPNNKG